MLYALSISTMRSGQQWLEVSNLVFYAQSTSTVISGQGVERQKPNVAGRWTDLHILYIYRAASTFSLVLLSMRISHCFQRTNPSSPSTPMIHRQNPEPDWGGKERCHRHLWHTTRHQSWRHWWTHWQQATKKNQKYQKILRLLTELTPNCLLPVNK